jgi:sugar O-acyltransferase (sialic acid O-acetyltransferase NeuD family)
MQRPPVVILGAGGFAREVLDVFEAAGADGDAREVLGFVVEPRHAAPGTEVNGLPVLGGLDWLEARRGAVECICGVGAPDVRRRMVAEAAARGARFCSVVHPTAVRTRWLTLGEGSVITAGCLLTNQITIGAHVHVNLGCTVGHDARLEALATLAPGVHVSGNVTLGEGCYLGTGAVILQQRSVGAWATVGAGAVVTQDVPPDATVVGMPARVVKQREAGWHLG